MHFDLFYELSNPDFLNRSECQLYHDTIAEIQWAESLGFSTVWLVEHHFMPAYSHSPAPDLFLAALAQATSRIRLGLAVIPLPFHHPVHIAERIATLDILSKGRIELGVGRGFSPTEFSVFSQNMAHSRAYSEESLAIIKKCFSQESVNFKGEFFQIDGIDVVPKPVQKPWPPLWWAAVSPESFQQAARLGLGVLAGPFKPWFMTKRDFKNYHHSYQKYHPQPSLQNNCQAGMVMGILCLEDGKHAKYLAQNNMLWFYQQLLRQVSPVLEKLHHSYEYHYQMGRWRGWYERLAHITVLEKLGMVIAGNPEHCLKRLTALAQQGVNRILCAVGAGCLPTEIVKESLHLLAHQVKPQLPS